MYLAVTGPTRSEGTAVEAASSNNDRTTLLSALAPRGTMPFVVIVL